MNELTYVLRVGSHEWLYSGKSAIHRATFAAQLMMRRCNVRIATISPYLFVGETIRVIYR
jgi:hypothetical protein